MLRSFLKSKRMSYLDRMRLCCHHSGSRSLLPGLLGMGFQLHEMICPQVIAFAGSGRWFT